MEQILATDESLSWEHQITKEDKLIATSKRLYVVNEKKSHVVVIFRKAITGCEYKFNNYNAVAGLLFGIGLVFGGLLMAAKIIIGAVFMAFFIFLGLVATCKEEKIIINLSGGDDITISNRKFFAVDFEKKLLPRIKDISSLEDL